LNLKGITGDEVCAYTSWALQLQRIVEEVASARRTFNDLIRKVERARRFEEAYRLIRGREMDEDEAFSIEGIVGDEVRAYTSWALQRQRMTKEEKDAIYLFSDFDRFRAMEIGEEIETKKRFEAAYRLIREIGLDEDKAFSIARIEGEEVNTYASWARRR